MKQQKLWKKNRPSCWVRSNSRPYFLSAGLRPRGRDPWHVKTIQSSAYGGRLERTWMTGNNDREEEEDAGGGVTDELAERRGGRRGFSLFSTEDLASRDLCVPVYMRKTKKKKGQRQQIQKKKRKKKKSCTNFNQRHTEPFSFSTSMVTAEPSVQRLCGWGMGCGGEPTAWRWAGVV